MKTTLTTDEKSTAIDWYCNKNYDLITIAQHFCISVEDLKKTINNQ